MNRYSAMTSDVKMWENHFKKMVNGELKPTKEGIFLVEKNNTSPVKGSDLSPQYKMVTPAAQAVEIAQSDIKHAQDQPKDSAPITYFPSAQESTDSTGSTTINTSTTKKKRGRPPKPKGVPPIAIETGSKKKKSKEEFWKLY